MNPLAANFCIGELLKSPEMCLAWFGFDLVDFYREKLVPKQSWVPKLVKD